ncbi:WD40 repeat-like protein [Lentinus tigrinus ALCF2SS1-7]|uniref:WD40 repeat-like protein n=1 Tax=Lentinus tigrinus ALCF2SS1-6 TaxID=1328759 RepID=A0A5C2SFD2_9APHY|nr:WD40 repeat-like protein [Lentinus tigrinus ALCF2SS1-6]RPD74354.1 WD40 repeat-like protein [Lentinus tigrinus ALCF2SS1-7]
MAYECNLLDRTNFFRREGATTGLPTPPSERKRVCHLDVDGREKKRLKFDLSGQENGGTDEHVDSDSEDEDWDALRTQRADYRYSVYALRNRGMLAGPSSVSRQPEPSTRLILQTFVSSHKADVFKCQSIDERTYITLPYACSYTHAAKRGGAPHIAVATEQGTVHILDTSKRRDWDVEPQRVTLQPHENGIFDVKWSSSDELLATASGDQSIRVTSVASSTRSAAQTLNVLRGHEGTVKSVAWDPNYDGAVLCSGGREGSICLWDLRVGEGRRDGEGTDVLTPVLTIAKAHESDVKSPKPKGRGRKLTTAAPLKSITQVLYTDSHPYGVVSSCSSDGILKLWDARLPSNDVPKKPSRNPKVSRPTALFTSSDPTTYGGTRRARGITTLAAGSGPTAGLLYALGTDSRIHTYSVPWLDPLSGVPPIELGTHDPHAHTHPNLQSNSFYVRLAGSPCGRWLAAGNAVDGRAYLFDVASAASAARARDVGRFGWEGAVELKGQTGEVGAMDWAEGMLATCADDGTVRVWRPDVEVARRCVDEPEEMKWEWSWTLNA